MTWPDILRSLIGPEASEEEAEQFQPGRGASEQQIEQLQSTIFAPLDQDQARLGEGYNFDARDWKLPDHPLPPSYLDLLRCSDGGEFGGGGRLIQLFSSGEVRAYMLDYQVPQYWPLAVPFAFDGGGTFYAFDMRQPPDARGEFPIVMAHAGSLGWEPRDSWKIAETLEECFRDPRSLSDLL